MNERKYALELLVDAGLLASKPALHLLQLIIMQNYLLLKVFLS